MTMGATVWQDWAAVGMLCCLVPILLSSIKKSPKRFLSATGEVAIRARSFKSSASIDIGYENLGVHVGLESTSARPCRTLNWF